MDTLVISRGSFVDVWLDWKQFFWSRWPRGGWNADFGFPTSTSPVRPLTAPPPSPSLQPPAIKLRLIPSLKNMQMRESRLQTSPVFASLAFVRWGLEEGEKRSSYQPPGRWSSVVPSHSELWFPDRVAIRPRWLGVHVRESPVTHILWSLVPSIASSLQMYWTIPSVFTHVAFKGLMNQDASGSFALALTTY